MTIGSLLVCLTATALGLAAFSPHAARAEDFPSFSFMKFRLESMRPELESYVSGISSAKRRKKTVITIAQASGKTHAVQQTGRLFDHLVGACEQHRRHV